MTTLDTSNIGALVYWHNLKGGASREFFREAMAFLDLEKAVGRDPRPERCLRDAVTRALSGQKRVDRVYRIKAEVKLKTSAEVTYSILVREDQGDKRGYLEAARIKLSYGQPDAPEVYVHNNVTLDAETEAVIANAISYYQDVRVNMTSQDVSDALTRSLEIMDSVSVRPGVHFVSPTVMKQLRGLSNIVNGVTGSSITIWDIASGGQNAESAKKELVVGLWQRMDALSNEIEEVCNADKPSTKSINARAAHLSRLSDQVALYSDILEDTAKEFDRIIEDAKRKLLDHVIPA